MIAWVAGHSHVNDVTPYPGPDGHGFWSVKVAAEADWPQQSRLLQLFDNHDGTLSLFGTIVDHASEATAPAPGTDAAALDPRRPRLDRPHPLLQRRARPAAGRANPTPAARAPPTTATSSC